MTPRIRFIATVLLAMVLFGKHWKHKILLFDRALDISLKLLYECVVTLIPAAQACAGINQTCYTNSDCCGALYCSRWHRYRRLLRAG